METEAKPPLAARAGSAWISSEWWAYRPSAIIDTEPWVRWSGPFESKDAADAWIGIQRGFPEGLRAGRAVVVWDESPNAPGSATREDGR